MKPHRIFPSSEPSVSFPAASYANRRFWTISALSGLMLAAACLPAALADDENPFTKHPEPPLVGRWDLTAHGPKGDYPSWLEVRMLGFRTLVGSYVGQFGSARPVSFVKHENGSFRFSIPPQWEHRLTDVVIEGKLDGDTIRGVVTDDEGKPLAWEGVRAPALTRGAEPKWGKAIDLFNGRDLAGWKQRFPDKKNGWVVRDGILANDTPGNDLLTESKFTDFKLHAEFRYPKGSNSGIYLRGRYEVQVEDNFGKAPDSHYIGGVYGFLTPNRNTAKPAGEWQTMDITLVGRLVTVALNGEEVIVRQNIPGITGGAMDSNEAAPGPVLLQGDHGPVEFRKVTITTAE
jgi:3-keto-disaccharide hydrolase